MKLLIGCDNIAVQMKQEIIEYLQSLGHTVEDIGVNSAQEDTHYPFIAKKLCEIIIKGDYCERGILICGTGIGMAISANKFNGIRAAVCHDPYSAERAILSNNANVLCMGARVIGIELAKKIINEWISLNYIDGRSTVKLEAIHQLETKNMK